MESSSRGGGGSGSRGRSPRLDRRNAVKHIEYEVGAGGAGPFASAGVSWSSSSSAEQRSPGLRPSHSLDLAPGPPGADFRISGSAEGEVDELCRSLGLSGPEDFSIPLDAWEARKSRSNSDLLPRSRPAADPLTPVARSTSAPDAKSQPPLSVRAPIPEESLHSSSTSTATDPTEDPTVVLPVESPKAVPVVAVETPAAVLPLPSPRRGSGEAGIRGARPPVLSTPPPPVLSPPRPITALAPLPARKSFVADDMIGSAWDIVHSFAPTEEKGELGQAHERMDASRTSDTEEEEEAEDDSAAVEGALKEMTVGETFEGFTRCSSLSTTNDDDASSTTTEAMFIISPNGKFKRKIKSWMRGALLGSGSFGMVYEGISE
jgi:mitogen-activated protein kinase kinase kinase 1